MSLYDKMGLLITPNGVAPSKIFAYKPTNGSGDGVFDRNTTATRVNSSGLIEDVAIDMARIDYPTNGSCPHLLFEPQSTNLITYSEDFINAYWGVNNVTVSLSNVLSPNGVDFAYKINGGSVGILSTLYNPSDVRTDSRSIWARTVSGVGNLHLLSHNSNSNNLFSITEEWQRFEVNSYSAIGAINFYAVDFRGSSNLTEVLIWGAQAEALPYATSYIPTNGSAVTRVQDVANNFGDVNTFNSEEGTLFVEMAALGNDGTFRRLSIGTNDNGFSDNINIRYNNVDNSIYYQYRTNNVYQCSLYSVIPNALDFIKIACVWKINRFELWVNGVKLLEDLVGSVASSGTFNSMFFGKTSTTLPDSLHGKVKQIQVYKEALTDLELEYLTTYGSFTDLANANNYNLILDI